MARGVHGWGCVCSREACVAWGSMHVGVCMAGVTHGRGYAWHAVDGTHPTGMHSCFSINNQGFKSPGDGYIFSAQKFTLLPVKNIAHFVH